MPEVLCGSLVLDGPYEWTVGTNGCGRPMLLDQAYRCGDCKRWYHRRCLMVNHFGRTWISEYDK